MSVGALAACRRRPRSSWSNREASAPCTRSCRRRTRSPSNATDAHVRDRGKPDCAAADLRRELVRGLAHHGSIFSRVGASGDPGAVQTDQRSGSIRQKWNCACLSVHCTSNAVGSRWLASVSYTGTSPHSNSIQRDTPMRMSSLHGIVAHFTCMKVPAKPISPDPSRLPSYG